MITSSYLIRGSKPCLVETGTARSAPVVVEQLASLGIGAQDLATIVVTHIHLDHAGGVGDLAQAFPNAQVVVHERGARHLADPSRLVASAHRVFGEVRETTLEEGLARMAPWAKAAGARKSGRFGDIEIEQGLPPSWRDQG